MKSARIPLDRYHFKKGKVEIIINMRHIDLVLTTLYFWAPESSDISKIDPEFFQTGTLQNPKNTKNENFKVKGL